MDAPPIQYVTTSDGVSIAYTSTGSGLPLVFMPWPFNNVGQIWETAFARPLLQALASRFKLIQYDHPGQGMSSRGLSEYHSMEDYLLDLEAIVDHLALQRFVLYGAPMFGHVAVRYAAQHPGRVRALALGDVFKDRAWGGYEDIAKHDWEAFLHTMVSTWSLPGAPRELDYWRGSMDQADGLHMMNLGMRSSISSILPNLKVPVLLWNPRRPSRDSQVDSLWVADAQAMAAAIPDARLVLYDGGFASVLYSPGPEPPPAVRFIEDFLSDLSQRAGGESRLPSATSLSPREVDVLRLVVQGKTNREIAEALVISQRTVINHISNIFTKTGAENRAAATAYAFRHGLA